MEVQLDDPAKEVKRLERCINDLVSLLALPAIWSGGNPSQVLHTLLDALIRMLSLDLVCVRLTNPVGGAPVEIVRIAQLRGPMPPPHAIFEALSHSLEDNSRKWPPHLRSLMGEGDVSIVPLPLGLQGEFGVIVAAAERADFPQQTETLLLNVAANQACIGLQEARLRSHQRRIADELEKRVAQRTAELGAANAELQLQVGLLQDLPVSAWTLKPDGTPDFVNRVWLEFSGQTLDFVRSHPEAWMTALHPDDREAASKAFWDGVRAGKEFAFETRSLRARDGTYRWHLQQAVVLRDAEGKVLKFVGTTTDIHEQKQAEEALRESEHESRLIVDSIPGQIAVLSASGEMEFVSQPLLDYYGSTLDEIKLWTPGDVVFPEDVPRLVDAMTHSLTSGEPLEVEARTRRFDGVYRWFALRGHPFRDRQGHIVRWYILRTDIDDKKRAEDALRKSERNLSLIINTMPALAWSARPDGSAEFLGQRWLNYTGMTATEAQGWGWAKAFHPDDVDRVIVYWRSILVGGEPGEIEARLRQFDGTYRWFLTRANPLRDESGNILKWYGICTDIEDRKRAEEALRARELDARSLLDNMPGFLARLSPDGAPEIFNRPFLQYLGKTLEDIGQWKTNDIIHPGDLAHSTELFGNAMATGRPFDFEYRLRRFDGVHRWFQVRGVPVRDGNGQVLHWNCLVTDIDDRKRAEEELRNAQSELARVMRVMTMGQLTASIAHEVNQPLSGITTNASTCLRMLDANPPNLEGARETARRTIRDGHRASDVIMRLRTLYSKKEPTVESMNLNEVAREVTALSSGEIQRNGVTLRQEFADDLPPALGDRVQLQQVILNLLRNAVEAMSTIDDRPRELLVRTERDDENRVRLSVKDSGVGLTPQAADKIFEAFYTTKTDGMGIGLSISRSIIEAHQGRLWATRNDGPGSMFSFSIPCSSGLAEAEIRVNRADPSTDAA